MCGHIPITSYLFKIYLFVFYFSSYFTAQKITYINEIKSINQRCNRQWWDDMSSQYHWEAWDSNVTHMCRPYFCAIRQMCCQGWQSDPFIVNNGTLHLYNEDGGCPCVCNGLVCRNSKSFKYCSKGLPTKTCAVVAIVVGAFKLLSNLTKG